MTASMISDLVEVLKEWDADKDEATSALAAALIEYREHLRRIREEPEMTKDKWGPPIPWKPGDPTPKSGTIQRIFEDDDGSISSGDECDASMIRLGWVGVIGYRVKREPVVATVSVSLIEAIKVPGLVHECRGATLVRGTVQCIDGQPDLTTITWEAKE